MAKDKANLDFLDLVGTSSSGYESSVELKSVTAVLNQAANAFILKAIQRINAKGGTDTGEMQDIQVIDENVTDEGGFITIGYAKGNPAAKYWKFQDQGVKGLDSNESPLSPYKFKKYTVGGEFLAKLVQWYTRHKNYIKAEDQRNNLTRIQRKRKTLGNVADNKIKGIAYATGRKIKREGLKPVGFKKYAFDNAFNDEFYSKLGKALGRDISGSITENE